MQSDTLDQIQTMQFRDRAGAEVLLLGFVRSMFPQLAIVRAELRPLAVSLNSFNGFLYLDDGERLFFKTHTEPGGIISEYYNAEQLADAGYPILRPLMKSGEAGKQLLIYPYVDAPSVFDVAWTIEQGDDRLMGALTQAQHALDDALFESYARTLVWQTADEAAHAPVHQLFSHRLTGGRLEKFYGAQAPALVIDGNEVAFADVRRLRWSINGLAYDVSLGDIIERAIRLVNPAQAGPCVVGHGDAHNGNVFFHTSPPVDGEGESERSRLSYFDPAFAGRHHPLLDVTKPLFHNVFAMWMYHPQEKAAQTRLSARIEDGVMVVEHDYALHPVRAMFLRSKVQRVLIPTLKLLHKRGWLREDWRAYLKAALFCCPLLTKNLLDALSYPPKTALLGLAIAVEMGEESVGGRSLIDSVLDEAASQLA